MNIGIVRRGIVMDYDGALDYYADILVAREDVCEIDRVNVVCSTANCGDGTDASLEVCNRFLVREALQSRDQKTHPVVCDSSGLS
jgi:hypothetical protein